RESRRSIPLMRTTNTIRLRGLITAEGPIMIRRPDLEEGRVLTMNIVDINSVNRVPVIPGETFKGLIRSLAYCVAADAAVRANPRLNVSLSRIYEQAKGGLKFTEEKKELGSDRALRDRHPLLSLFGAASPILEGRCQFGVGKSTVPAAAYGTGMPGGARRDPVTTNPMVADLLSDEEKAKFASRSIAVADGSAAKMAEKAAATLLAAAKRKGLGEEEIASREADLAAAKDALEQIKKGADFDLAMQRPVPAKPAAPIGTDFSQTITIRDVTDIELGLLLAAFELLGREPLIGGGVTAGCGGISVLYDIDVLTDTDETGSRSAQYKSAGSLVIEPPKCPAHVREDDGSVTLKSYDPEKIKVVRSEHPVILGAVAAWAKAEASILTAFDIFAPTKVTTLV
ncbi:MAG: hypothetical protein WCF85_18165, partial [Rhodospirillaceae bacterium]